MDLGLKNKNVLITGSTKGLGLSTAEVLLGEGSHVVINSRSQENVDAAINKLRGKNSNSSLHGISGDVTDESFCQSLIDINLL